MKRQFFSLLMMSSLFVVNSCFPGTHNMISSEEIVSTGSHQEESQPSESSNPRSSESYSQDSGTSISSSSEEKEEPPIGNAVWNGVEAISAPKGRYFNPMNGVTCFSSNGIDLTRSVSVFGYVDWGRTGTYSLTYEVAVGEVTGSIKRSVEITDGSLPIVTRNRTDGLDRSVTLGSGSYRTGNVASVEGESGNLFKRAPSPIYLDNEAFNKGPVPTNKFWTGMMYSNHGGATSLCLNPLTAAYKDANSFGQFGLSLQYRKTGFTQYFSVADTLHTQQTTMENFRSTFDDILILPNTHMTSSYVTMVEDYGENSVDIAMRNSVSGEDEMVSHFDEGSPFVFHEVKDRSGVILDLRIAGIDTPYTFYDTNGTKITGSNYLGDGLIIGMPHAHYGYATTYPSTAIGAAQYEDIYFLLNAPKGTKFTLSQGKHPNAAFYSRIEMNLINGNYFSVAGADHIAMAKELHSYGYTKPLLEGASFTCAGNSVETTFSSAAQHLDSSSQERLFSLYPHQWKYADTVTLENTTRTFRGVTKFAPASSFSTHYRFYGVQPSFVYTDLMEVDRALAKAYVQQILDDTIPSPTLSLEWEDSSKDFANAPGPYWNSKALYPLSQGLIIADQLGENDLRDSVLDRLEYFLKDWYTYGGPDDVRYLFYDETFGGLLYSTNNFNTNARMSDHHFTSGYLVFASAVVAMYDANFLVDYGEMVKLLLKDYLNYDSDSRFPYLRGFDTYAGHSWADGIGDFGDGNDQESCGEALNAWTAGYLLGVALQEETLVKTSAYGFATELVAVKQYWFNYDEDNWISSLSANTHALGIVWGGKNSCATWFGSNPEFIYGIHWLPTGEYLTNYALGSSEKAVLKTIYSEMENRCGGAPRTWFSNLWAIEAIVDSAKALNDFDATKIQGDDYKDELAGSYWMAHGLNTYGQKFTQGYFEVNGSASGTVYEKNGALTGMVWNPGGETNVTYVNGDKMVSYSVPAHSFIKISL